ncbi:MAG: DegT/DnrJ/EryC1/StrS family aminotransferase [Chloroflexi bacterium]|nr:DegT/DnrJ/EryC1/StrS family aminotransferase [Chloroflexota bacterium]
MSVPLVDLKAQYHAIKADVDAAVARIFENGSFILGAEVRDFEQAFAHYCHTGYAVGVSSGTAALQLSLMACDIGPGDEVITTPFTFIATAAAISHVGARPVFVDIDPRTYNIDPAKIKAAITPRTRAILPVHLYGQPADMDPILELARRHGLRVIEDACQAVGATYHGRKAGSMGDLGCFSFYPSKNLGGAGDGGMVVTNDKELAERVRILRDHGRTDHYGHQRIGFTHRLDALQAAVLGAKLRYLDTWNEMRRAHAATYNELLASCDLVTPFEAEGCRSVYHLYVVRVSRRDELLAALHESGIGAGVHYPCPVHLQPAYAELGLSRGSHPIAETCADTVLSLPMYPEMTREHIDQVVEALNACMS